MNMMKFSHLAIHTTDWELIISGDHHVCQGGRSTPYIDDAMVILLLIENPNIGYVNPYYWVDEVTPKYIETMGVDGPVAHVIHVLKLTLGYLYGFHLSLRIQTPPDRIGLRVPIPSLE